MNCNAICAESTIITLTKKRSRAPPPPNSPEPAGIPAEPWPKRKKVHHQKKARRYGIPAREGAPDRFDDDEWEVEAEFPEKMTAELKPKTQVLPFGVLLSKWNVCKYKIRSASSRFNACFIHSLFHCIKKKEVGFGTVTDFLLKCAAVMDVRTSKAPESLIKKIREFCSHPRPRSLPQDLWSPESLKVAAATVMKTDIYIINGYNISEGPLKLDNTVLVEKFCKDGTHSALTLRKLKPLEGDARVLFWPKMQSNHWYFVKLTFDAETEAKVSAAPDEWGEDLFDV